MLRRCFAPFVLASGCLALLGAGCGKTGGSQIKGPALAVAPPKLSTIYGRSAQYVYPGRNPVIVIHGILGAKLEDRKTGKTVWGEVSFLDSLTADADARAAALPMRPGVPLRELTDNVVPVGVLDQVKIGLVRGSNLLPLTFNAYAKILETLGAGGYQPQGFVLGPSPDRVEYGLNNLRQFQFAYDWRRDNVENARRLHEFILTKRKIVQDQIELVFGIKDYDVRFDIVAHSMGGLITRYMLMYGPTDLPADGAEPAVTWAGARYVEHAVIVGTPNAGLADAFVHLVSGAQFAPILPAYPPAALGTMPSIYQLMPRTRHNVLMDAADPSRQVGDLYDAALWEKYGWGLADPAQDRVLRYLLPDVSDAAQRRAIALDHQKKCLGRAKQFHAAIDRPGAPPEGTRLYLFAGDAVETSQMVLVDTKTGEIRVGRTAPGDGIVLRSSALMDETEGSRERWRPRVVTPIDWTGVFFLRDDHMGITSTPDFSNNLLYILLQSPKHPPTATQPAM